MTVEHPVTRHDVELTSVYEHLAWYANMTRPYTRASQDPADQLEELARVSVIVRTLDHWQAIGVHRAVLAGATSEQLSQALGEAVEALVERWHAWSVGQRSLWRRCRDRGDMTVMRGLRFDPAEHEHVAMVLGVRTEHVFTGVQDSDGEWYARCGCGWLSVGRWPTEYAAREFTHHEHINCVRG